MGIINLPWGSVGPLGVLRKLCFFAKFGCFMCSLITPILLAIETVTDMKPEETRKHAKLTTNFTQTHNCQTRLSTVAGPKSKQKLGSLLLQKKIKLSVYAVEGGAGG